MTTFLFPETSIKVKYSQENSVSSIYTISCVLSECIKSSKYKSQWRNEKDKNRANEGKLGQNQDNHKTMAKQNQGNQ